MWQSTVICLELSHACSSAGPRTNSRNLPVVLIDVLEDLSVNLGFQYTLMLPSNAYDGYDGSYGQTVRDVESLGAKGNFYAGPLFITPARITNLYLTSPVPSIFLSFLWSHAVK